MASLHFLRFLHNIMMMIVKFQHTNESASPKSIKQTSSWLVAQFVNVSDELHLIFPEKTVILPESMM